MRIFETIDDVLAAEGQHLGVSGWRTVDQARIDAFADATGDHQWIHVDPERAKGTPAGRTIAHGFLTLSMISDMSTDVIRFDFGSMWLNYGLDRVRFITSVPSGSRVRDSILLTSVESAASGHRLRYRHTVSIDGVEKAACIADTITFVAVDEADPDV